jgi:hypothetical protein
LERLVVTLMQRSSPRSAGSAGEPSAAEGLSESGCGALPLSSEAAISCMRSSSVRGDAGAGERGDAASAAAAAGAMRSTSVGAPGDKIVEPSFAVLETQHPSPYSTLTVPHGRVTSCVETTRAPFLSTLGSAFGESMPEPARTSVFLATTYVGIAPGVTGAAAQEGAAGPGLDS